MATVSRTATAERDLGEIWAYVAQDNPAAATEMLFRINDRANLYAENSELGTLCSELASGLRCFSVGNYVTFYLPMETGILLVRVLHRSRDIPRLFKQFDFDH